ncbi:hypothetical protein BLNAU_4405 [Blattamonas nauphoetae]|uniref:Uncharacterized protein n=1 Tax=Blattamonas nauphoetae TaxID=2049346 RepID=A0ABQ9Y9S7_9EUKA|nr:hypothetical protein BLNAU_4405 [Blattamonas nauphoetae]
MRLIEEENINEVNSELVTRIVEILLVSLRSYSVAEDPVSDESLMSLSLEELEDELEIARLEYLSALRRWVVRKLPSLFR